MIREVSETLVDVIEQATPDLESWVDLSSLSAADADPTVRRLALALYAVEEHPHLRQPAAGVLPDRATSAPRSPSGCTTSSPTSGRTTRPSPGWRASSRCSTRRRSSGPPRCPRRSPSEVATLTVRLVTTTADERNQIWGALGRSARLALFYDVDVAPVDLLAHDGAGSVRTHRIDYVGAP